MYLMEIHDLDSVVVNEVHQFYEHEFILLLLVMKHLHTHHFEIVRIFLATFLS